MKHSHPEVMTMRTTKASGRSSIQNRRSTSTDKGNNIHRSKPSSGAVSIPGTMALKGVSDRKLLSDVRRLSDMERETVLSILVHLIEIYRRRLYLEMGYSSLFKLCVKELKYSESVAGRRVAVVRCIRRFPRAYRALASGRVNMTNLARIASIMNESNEKALLRSIVGATGKEVEHLVSRHDPKSVVRDRVRPVHVRTEIRLRRDENAANSKNDTSKSLDRRAGTTPTSGSGKSPNSPGAVDMFSGSGSAAATESGSEAAASGDTMVMVLEERFEIKFGASQGFLDKMDHLRSLLSSKHHRHHEFEELFMIVMDEYIERHSPEGRIKRKEKRQQRKAARTSEVPKSDSKQKPDRKEVSRYIPRNVRDEVHARDKGRCTYVSPGGRRCGSTWDLQVDHIVPFARGGDNSPSNLRLLCGKHNRLEAERVYGKEKMTNHAKRPMGKYVKEARERYIRVRSTQYTRERVDQHVKEHGEQYLKEYKGHSDWGTVSAYEQHLPCAELGACGHSIEIYPTRGAAAVVVHPIPGLFKSLL